MAKQSLQQTINQLSLVMTTSEEIMRACKAAETHPLLAEVLIKIHTSQKDVETEIRTLRTSQLEMAKVIAQITDLTAASYTTMTALADKAGIDFSKLVNQEEEL